MSWEMIRQWMTRNWQDPSAGTLLVGLWLAVLVVLIGGEASGVIDVSEALRSFPGLRGPRAAVMTGSA